MQTELKFLFANTDEKDFKILTNATRYHKVIRDLNGWLNKEIDNGQHYYDKETLEYIWNKLWEIIHSHDVDIYKEGV